MSDPLYKLTGQYLDLMNMASDEDSLNTAIADTLEAIEGEFTEKAKRVAYMIRNFDADCTAIGSELERLGKRKRTIEARIEGLREYLSRNMAATGIEKISDPLFAISLRAGSKSVAIDDESKLPAEYVVTKTTTAPDKRAIKSAIEAGIEVSGAHIETGKPSVQIK